MKRMGRVDKDHRVLPARADQISRFARESCRGGDGGDGGKIAGDCWDFSSGMSCGG